MESRGRMLNPQPWLHELLRHEDGPAHRRHAARFALRRDDEGQQGRRGLDRQTCPRPRAHPDAAAAVDRFISAEPLLGPLSLRWGKWDNWKGPSGQRRAVVDHLDGARMLDWVIVGGESGPGARPMHPAWARSLRDQCAEAGVPFFFKQWGEFEQIDGDPLLHIKALRGHGLQTCTFEDGVRMGAVGKKAAGRLLDGVEHNGMPGAA